MAPVHAEFIAISIGQLAAAANIICAIIALAFLCGRDEGECRARAKLFRNRISRSAERLGSELK